MSVVPVRLGSARSERRGWPHPHPRRHRSRPTRILSPAWKTQASSFLVLQGLSCGTRHTPQGCAQNDARSAPPPPAVPACLFRPSLRLPLRALRPGRFSLNALVENALWRPHPLATTPPGVRNTQSHRGSWAVWTVPPCAGPGGGYGDPGTYRGHVLALAACAVSSLAWGGERLPWALQSRPALWLGKEGWICFV